MSRRSAFERLHVCPGDASLTVGGERVRPAPCRVGAQHLHRMRAHGAGARDRAAVGSVREAGARSGAARPATGSACRVGSDLPSAPGRSTRRRRSRDRGPRPGRRANPGAHRTESGRDPLTADRHGDGDRRADRGRGRSRRRTQHRPPSSGARRRASGGGSHRAGRAGRAAPHRRPRSPAVRGRGSLPGRSGAASCESATATRSTETPRRRDLREHVPDLGSLAVESLVGVALPVGEAHGVAGAELCTAPRTSARSRTHRRPATGLRCPRSTMHRRAGDRSRSTGCRARPRSGTTRRAHHPVHTTLWANALSSSIRSPAESESRCCCTSRGSGCPARTASSCAAIAAPYSTAIDDKSAHSSRATTPASGPYASPNELLSWTKQPEAQGHERPEQHGHAAAERQPRPRRLVTPRRPPEQERHRRTRRARARAATGSTFQIDAPMSSLIASPISLPNANAKNDNEREQPDADREQEPTAVLLRRRAVLLDAVEAVERAFHLAHQRRPRHERAEEPEHERDPLPRSPARAVPGRPRR